MEYSRADRALAGVGLLSFRTAVFHIRAPRTLMASFMPFSLASNYLHYFGQANPPGDTFPIGVFLRKFFNHGEYKATARDAESNKKGTREGSRVCACVQDAIDSRVQLRARSFIRLFTGHVFKGTPFVSSSSCARVSLHPGRTRYISVPTFMTFRRGCGFTFNCERDSSRTAGYRLSQNESTRIPGNRNLAISILKLATCAVGLPGMLR